MTLHYIEPLILFYTPSDYDHQQSDINAVSSCLTSKYLSLNASKCCCLLLSRKRLLSIPLPSLTVGDASLTQVSCYRYLGVLITSDLMRSSHITNICNKTRRLVGILYRNFYKFSSPDTMPGMYSSFISPDLGYSMAVWDRFLKILN